MADRTLTINHADGDSETYTIKRDKFAGVRSMSVDGDTVTVDHTAVPKEQAKETTFGGSQSITIKREIEPLLSEVVGGASAAYSLRDLNDKAGNSKVVRVRRASDNHEKDFRAKEVKDIETWVNTQTVLPLDIQELQADGRTGDLVEAAAAYSLRNLSSGGTSLTTVGDTQTDYFSFTGATGATAELNGIQYEYVFPYNGAGLYNSAPPAPENSQMVRDTDGSWLLFIAGTKTYARSTTGTAQYPWDADWTGTDLENATFTQQRTGDFVVQVRRSSDGETKSFTAAEVADGTLENWVDADIDRLDLRAESGGLAGNVSNETATSFDFSVNNEGSTGFKTLAAPADVGAGTYVATFDVVLTSGSLSGITLASALPFAQTSLVLGSNSVTLNPDETSGIYFRTAGTAVADVSITNITLTQTSADGHVSKWYDQSGNDNHATQGTSASQPKIVDGGSLVTGGLDFDGVDDGLFTVSNLTDTFQSATIFALTQDNTTSGVAAMVRIRPNGIPSAFDGVVWEKDTNDTYGANTLIEGANAMLAAATTGQGTRTTTENLNTLIYQPSQILAYENGTLDATLTNVRSGSVPIGDVTLVDQLWIGQNFDDNARPFNGTMSEVIIYFTDQSDNRTAIEANIGETYDIDLPSGVDTGYEQVDGFVETWYDQSGNGNDATQLTAGNQPKIVDAGALVTGGIDFDGVNDGLFTSSNFTDTLQSATFFAVTKDDTTSGKASMVRIRPNGAYGAFDGISWEKDADDTYGVATYIDGANGTVSASAVGQGTRNTSKNLNTLIYQQSQILAYENGALDATLNTVGSGSVPIGDVTLVDQLWIGQNFDDNARPFNGTMSEVIIYFTDQSANREAIEANINNQYDIY